MVISDAAAVPSGSPRPSPLHSFEHPSHANSFKLGRFETSTMGRESI